MNADHKPQKKLLFGCSGSGKSTLFHKLLQAGGYKWIYVFDWDLKVSRSLHWQAACTVNGLCRLQDAGKPVLFYPRQMFPDLEEAFAFFCRFVMAQVAGRNGKKLFGADELQQYTSPHFLSLPTAFKELLNYGRNEEVDLVLASQHIADLHSRVKSQSTEIYIFKHSDIDQSAFTQFARMGIDPEQVKALPHPSVSERVGWLYKHTLTGRTEIVTHAINAPSKRSR